MSPEALAKLAVAREMALKKRREMSAQRSELRESKVQEKMQMAQEKQAAKIEKSAEKEAARRMKAEPAVEPAAPPERPKAQRNTVCIEYSSSDSDNDLDFQNTRVLFVKKQRDEPREEKRDPAPAAARPDPLAKAYLRMFGGY